MADKVHICVVYFKWSFVFTGTMCLISAYTTNYWQQNSHTRIGLWKICEGGINCSSIKFEENADGRWQTKMMLIVRVGFLAGIIFGLITFVMITFKTRWKDELLLHAYIPETIAAMLCFYSMIVYTTEMRETEFNFNYSYIMGWVGTGMYLAIFFVMTVVLVMRKCNENKASFDRDIYVPLNQQSGD